MQNIVLKIVQAEYILYIFDNTEEKMFFIKFIIYILIFSSSTYIGILISKQYSNRVTELKELKTSLNVLKTKIRFTSEPLQDIFQEISINTKGNISNLFKRISNDLKSASARTAWEEAIDKENLSIKKEDRQALKTLGKLLGRTDLEGQISEIELTESFLETQIMEAQNEKDKNEKLYKTLGMISGVGIIVILI